MNLDQFDTREKASSGVDFPLIIDGETIISDEDGQPITFRLKGVADESVHREFLRQQRSPATTPEDVKNADMKLALLAVVGWSDNFTVGDEKLEFSRENIRKVMDNPTVRKSVVRMVLDQKAFMKGR